RPGDGGQTAGGTCPCCRSSPRVTTRGLGRRGAGRSAACGRPGTRGCLGAPGGGAGGPTSVARGAVRTAGPGAAGLAADPGDRGGRIGRPGPAAAGARAGAGGG